MSEHDTAPLSYLIDAACRHLGGMSRDTIDRHIKRGTIRAVRIGGRVLVPHREIERVLGLVSRVNGALAIDGSGSGRDRG